MIIIDIVSDIEVHISYTKFYINIVILIFVLLNSQLFCFR